MQKSQLFSFLIVAGITLVMLAMLIIVLQGPANYQRAEFLGLIEVSFSQLLRFIGLSLLLFSIVSLVMAGPNAIELKNYAKWIILIIASMLIMNPAWYLVFGVVIILATLIIIEYLKSNCKPSE